MINFIIFLKCQEKRDRLLFLKIHFTTLCIGEIINKKFLEYIDEDFEKARRIYLKFIKERLKENNKFQKLPSFIDEKTI